jgi:pyruvate formate lyase activating enzyme
MHEALQYTKLEGGTVHCSLCNHRCIIKEGKHGVCGIRINQGGVLYAAAYGKVSAEAIDPIEKKPLYHFLPGSLSYSLGGVGCNFRCEHCQNWHISRAGLLDGLVRDLPPEEGVARALAHGCRSISWTYNEPAIWHEYPLDMGRIAKERGLGTIYVTNGYITEEGLREAATMLDAYRVDLKSFSEEFYKKVCGAKLQPVLDSTALAYELGLHVETVTLVIPGLNDSADQIDGLIRWVIDHCGPDTPMHFTAFHPDYKMRDRPATPLALLEKIYRRAKELGLHYPYIGNVMGTPYEHTYCPACGAMLIERSGRQTWFRGLEDERCGACGEQIPYVSSPSG